MIPDATKRQVLVMRRDRIPDRKGIEKQRDGQFTLRHDMREVQTVLRAGGDRGMNANIIGCMSRAEGYMVALASIAADREICGDNRQSFLMETANEMSAQIRAAINYITNLEKQMEELKDELREMRLRHPDKLQK